MIRERSETGLEPGSCRIGKTAISRLPTISKGEVNSSALPQYMAAVDLHQLLVTFPYKCGSYFIIRALVTKTDRM